MKFKIFSKKIDNKPGEHGKGFMEIKFNSDDNFPLNKLSKFHNLRIIIRSVFEKDGKYYQKTFLNE